MGVPEYHEFDGENSGTGLGVQSRSSGMNVQRERGEKRSERERERENETDMNEVRGESLLASFPYTPPLLLPLVLVASLSLSLPLYIYKGLEIDGGVYSGTAFVSPSSWVLEGSLAGVFWRHEMAS